MTAGKELGNGVTLGEVALGGLEKGELVGGVDFLVTSFLSGLLIVNDKGRLVASHAADDSAGVDENVSSELGVDFL